MTAEAPGTAPRVELYDTTLRDGAQGTGFSYSIEDRLRILHKLDQLGVPFIEGGWPGANPRDTEFFKLATKETLRTSTLTAFGMTRKAGERVEDSAVLRDLLDAGTEYVCLVGKSWDLHVTEALRTDLDEGSRWCATRSRSCGTRAAACSSTPSISSTAIGAIRCSRCACSRPPRRPALSGSCSATRTAACCRSTSPRIVDEVRGRVETPLGIHVHNDAGCAVANSLIAVEHGAFQVQGVVNGYGERTGNADLIPIAANLTLKMGVPVLPDGAIERLTEVAHYVAEVANVAPDARQPYAGRYAFTHKAGLHASGVARITKAYEHVDPETVGNHRGVVASDLGGAATLRMKAAEFGVELADSDIPALLTDLKEREAQGYTFEVADASLELLMRQAHGWRQDFFQVESYMALVTERWDEGAVAEATVKVVTKGERHIEAAEGHGPVGALDNALRKALSNEYPAARRHGARGLPRARAGRDGRHRCGRARADRHVERRA